MVDVTEKFIEDSASYIGADNSRIGQKYVESLHEFEPRERHYDLIWIQWVTGHLTDEDFVNFFRRCAVSFSVLGTFTHVRSMIRMVG